MRLGFAPRTVNRVTLSPCSGGNVTRSPAQARATPIRSSRPSTVATSPPSLPS